MGVGGFECGWEHCGGLERVALGQSGGAPRTQAVRSGSARAQTPACCPRPRGGEAWTTPRAPIHGESSGWAQRRAVAAARPGTANPPTRTTRFRLACAIYWSVCAAIGLQGCALAYPALGHPSGVVGGGRGACQALQRAPPTALGPAHRPPHLPRPTYPARPIPPVAMPAA